MESIRKEFAKRMESLLGNEQFKYGSYKERPKLPYGNYARENSDNFMADDIPYLKINVYIIRLVTAEKDFLLEDKVEDILDELEIPYNVITDEDIEREKCHCTEWMVSIHENR